MKTFRDNAGREWLVKVHVAGIARVRDTLGVDLYGLVDDGLKGLGGLLGDPVGLVDVIYVLCRKEAEQRGVTDEDFGEAMAGDAIEAATAAFLEALTDFFPNPRVRAGLTRLLEASRTLRGRLIDHMEATLAGLDLEAEARRLIASSGGSPAPSGSTPDPSPSAN